MQSINPFAHAEPEELIDIEVNRSIIKILEISRNADDKFRTYYYKVQNYKKICNEILSPTEINSAYYLLLKSCEYADLKPNAS